MIQCSLVLSIFLFLEKLLLQVISVNFHRRAYAERIVEQNFANYVVERLYVAKKKIFAERKKRLQRVASQASMRKSNKFLFTSPGSSPPDGQAAATSSSKSVPSLLKKRRSVPTAFPSGQQHGTATSSSVDLHPTKLASSPDAPPGSNGVVDVSTDPSPTLSHLQLDQGAIERLQDAHDTDAASTISESTRQGSPKRFQPFNFLKSLP